MGIAAGPSRLRTERSVTQFFLSSPLHNLAVDDPDNIVTVLVFVGVAVFIGRLTARARADARLAGRRAQTMEDLYVFARRLTTINDLAALTDLTVGHVAAALGVEVILILPERGGTGRSRHDPCHRNDRIRRRCRGGRSMVERAKRRWLRRADDHSPFSLPAAAGGEGPRRRTRIEPGRSATAVEPRRPAVC
ncbi:DUF4118 domain-containing protein [Defluviicoccus vanus]|uniref:DUF4118 domain-containing protein n=1 Tax=Defluviicoccus vanus TaxID=111831 RepID=A0A7H1N4U2_9PROT|nr:DUF4118 domain-containing protein [Defluviicoccus vanus]